MLTPSQLIEMQDKVVDPVDAALSVIERQLLFNVSSNKNLKQFKVSVRTDVCSKANIEKANTGVIARLRAMGYTVGATSSATEDGKAVTQFMVTWRA